MTTKDQAHSLTIGQFVSVSFFSNSGERKGNQGEKKSLQGVVVKPATLAKTTEQYVVTIETEKGFRSFPCHTIISLEVK